MFEIIKGIIVKKIILILFAFIMFCSPALAVVEAYDLVSTKEIILRRKKIQEVGYKLLNANGIDKRMKFSYAYKNKAVNAYTSHRNREIFVTKGMMDELDSDDELAFILGHEISHGVDFYRGPLRGYFYFPVIPPKERRVEIRSDLRAVDFVVKAGYNPLASIIISNKIMSQPRYEWYSFHPLSSRRLALIYAHIYQKYPYFLANNEYIDNSIYQNFLLTSKENRINFKNALGNSKNSNQKVKPKFN